MKENLSNYLRKYLELLGLLCRGCLGSNDYLKKVWCDLVRSEVELMIKNLDQGHQKDVIRSLKLILECSIQSSYLYLKHGGNTDKILNELKRRDKLGTSFNMSMISRIPNLNPRIKKEIIRAYLDVSTYVHPTIKLIMNCEGRTIPLQPLICRSLDIATYLACRLCGREITANIKNLVSELGFERCAKYLRIT